MLCYALKHDNGDSIIEYTLSKDDTVELRVYFVGIEDGENGDGIRRTECRAEDQAL